MQQKFGTAMGSPLSAVIANFYMEKLQRKALQTASAECRSKILKRYVDDVLDVIKKDQDTNFSDHLNSIDDTNSTAHWHLADVLVGNHLFFVIFAVLDVSCAVNSCINHSF